jgi:hypothetical protein
MSSLNFDLLPHNYLVIGVWDSLRCTSISNSMSIKLRSGQYIPMSILTLDIWPLDFKINGGLLLFMMYRCTKFKVCQAKAFQNVEWSVYSYVQFDLDLLTSKSRVYIYCLGHTSLVYWVWSLSSKGFSRYWANNIFLFTVLIDLELWPIDLKFNRGLCLLSINPHIKYYYNLMKISTDIERTSFSLPTDRQMQSNMHIFEGGQN